MANYQDDERFYEQQDIYTPQLAKLEIGTVANYEPHTSIGYIGQGSSLVQFKNVTTENLSTGDKVVIAYANNIDTLLCIGVYERTHPNA